MVNKKSYSWEEIKNFLVKELKKTKCVMTFGTIGSCNIKNDIDLIITKKPNSKTSNFYKEIHFLFDEINNYLKKKYHSKLIRLPGVSFVPEFNKLFNVQKNDLLFHTMIYSSYSQMQEDWKWALFNNEPLEGVLNEYSLLLGNKKDLFSDSFRERNYADNIFLYLSFYDRTNSIYIDSLLLEVMNYYLDFLYRKRLKIGFKTLKSKKEIRESFYFLCDKIDELNKK